MRAELETERVSIRNADSTLETGDLIEFGSVENIQPFYKRKSSVLHYYYYYYVNCL